MSVLEEKRDNPKVLKVYKYLRGLHFVFETAGADCSVEGGSWSATSLKNLKFKGAK